MWVLTGLLVWLGIAAVLIALGRISEREHFTFKTWAGFALVLAVLYEWANHTTIMSATSLF